MFLKYNFNYKCIRPHSSVPSRLRSISPATPAIAPSTRMMAKPSRFHPPTPPTSAASLAIAATSQVLRRKTCSVSPTARLAATRAEARSCAASTRTPRRSSSQSPSRASRTRKSSRQSSEHRATHHLSEQRARSITFPRQSRLSSSGCPTTRLRHSKHSLLLSSTSVRDQSRCTKFRSPTEGR